MTIEAIAREAERLPDAAIELLIDQHPKSYRRLTECRLSDEHAIRMMSKCKLQAHLAESLYRRGSLSSEALSFAILKANESRVQPLHVIMSRGELGHDIQDKLTGRKMHSDVSTRMINAGLTLKAASRMLARNELQPDELMMVMEQHADALDAELVAKHIGGLYQYPVYAGWLLTKREDVRRLVIDEGDAKALALVSSIRLDESDQEIVVSRLEGQSFWGDRAAAAMLDRPTTAMKVRKRLWSDYSERLHRQGFLAPEVDLWPEVERMGDLPRRDMAMALQRAENSTWANLRTIQIVEAIHEGAHEDLQEQMWRYLCHAMSIGAYQRRGMAWLVELGECPLQEVARMLVNQIRSVEDRNEKARRALTFEGVDCQVSTTQIIPEKVKADESVELANLARHQYDAHRAGVQYLVEALGEDKDAWQLVLSLVDKFPGSVKALVQTAKAASGG